jgi:uncharacterized protein (TIGR03435 family)
LKRLLSFVGALLLAWSAISQAQSPSRPQFEVASLKPSAPTAPGEPININLGTFRNGRMTLGNVTLGDCIKYAYGIISDEQIAGPDWTKGGTVRFDIVAQTPPDTPQEQALLMLQSLLAERLKLAVHHEQRPLSFVALTVGRNGVKFGPANPGGPVALRNGQIIHSRISMQVLATLISRFERQTVLDMTGLTGFYEVKLTWTPDVFKGRTPPGGGPIMFNGEAIDPDGPSLATAVSEQLGLRLESRKGPVDVVVIDHAEKAPVEGNGETVNVQERPLSLWEASIYLTHPAL